jgi:hypothetical protein
VIQLRLWVLLILHWLPEMIGAPCTLIKIESAGIWGSEYSKVKKSGSLPPLTCKVYDWPALTKKV